MRRRLVPVALAAALLGVSARPLFADETTPEPIHVEYGAPATCPSALEFSGQVFRRTRHARLAAEGERARAFVVRITLEKRVRGVLELRDLDGVASVRNVAGKTCDEVVAALALVTALAIDPTASTAPVESLPLETPDASIEASPPDVAPEAEVDAAPEPLEAAAPPPSPPGEETTRTRVSAALGVQARTGLFPDFGALGGAAVGVAFDRPHVLAPELRLALSLALPDDAATSFGHARFSFVGGRFDACPVRIRPLPSVDLRPCAAVEIGRLGAEGTDIPDSQTTTRTWLAAGPLLRARLRPGLGELFFELEAGMPIAFVRDRYVVDPPGAMLYRAPPLGAAGALGLGWEIW